MAKPQTPKQARAVDNPITGLRSTSAARDKIRASEEVQIDDVNAGFEAEEGMVPARIHLALLKR